MRYLATTLAFLALASFPAAADVVDFANLTNTNISFTGDGTGADFTMSKILTGSNLAGFEITSGALSGLHGAISGVYRYNSSDIVITGGLQTAVVSLKTGPNTFTIWDSDGPGASAFTATVNWIEIYTLGTSGALNSGGAINLTGFSYSGSNATLLNFLTAGTGSLSATFQFNPGKSLTALASSTGNPKTSSYSGTLTVPDGGLTAMLLGGALVGIAALRRRVRV